MSKVSSVVVYLLDDRFCNSVSGEDLGVWSLQTTPVIVVGSAQAVFGTMYILMVWMRVSVCACELTRCTR